MKKIVSKKEAQDKIDELFARNSFSPEDAKKMKRLAMNYKISLKEKRKLFCKYCMKKLEGRIRVSSTHKIIECAICKTKNKIKIKS